MSLNTAHASGGVLIHAGEIILVFSDNVTIEFSGVNGPAFGGKKTGRIYLTTHRMIFTNKKGNDPLQSFSFPFVTLREVEIEQPVFGANYIRGRVVAQPNGNWEGEAKFKLVFSSGGAIEYGQAMLRAAKMASRSMPMHAPPPPYSPPAGNWYAAPPPAYTPPQGPQYGWVPLNQFPSAPPANSVYMTDLPPPYPGINGYSGYAATPNPVVQNAQNQSAADAKAAEAAQSAYYDASNPQYAYVPPPHYSESPPSYDEATKKAQ